METETDSEASEWNKLKKTEVNQVEIDHILKVLLTETIFMHLYFFNLKPLLNIYACVCVV